jgi:hypothetical protein
MTFGQGKQLVPHRKQAAPPKVMRKKELRKQAKQARAQVQQNITLNALLLNEDIKEQLASFPFDFYFYLFE